MPCACNHVWEACRRRNGEDLKGPIPIWWCRHFDEAPAPCHGMCDVCKTEPPQARDQQLQDVTDAATGALSTLARHGQEKRATLAQLVDKWRSNKVRGPTPVQPSCPALVARSSHPAQRSFRRCPQVPRRRETGP